MESTDKQQVIDISKMWLMLCSKKKLFYKVWLITFVLSCIWIFPQPRYYTAEVKLAPEISGEDVGSGLSSIASSFGFNLGGLGGSQDAIYPELYPDLFESPEFIVGLYDIHVKTQDGEISSDYYTYMRKYQKANPLMIPFNTVKEYVSGLLAPNDDVALTGDGKVNPFLMSKKDFELMEAVANHIQCAIDRKTRVISISVLDQDPLVCATMADSVKAHLQAFIIRYRTSKVSDDVNHYQQMRDSAEMAYDLAMDAYSRFCDAHKNIVLQSFQSERDKLESELAIRQNTLTAMETQLQATKVKMQEKTPAFTTLKSATVPLKPARPKRMVFVAGMLVLVTIMLSLYIIFKGRANIFVSRQ